MKLIINIPDHLYTVIKNKECTHRNVLTEAIYDGIPLDEIRAEIEKISIAPFATAYTAKRKALEIIDRYREGKQE